MKFKKEKTNKGKHPYKKLTTKKKKCGFCKEELNKKSCEQFKCHVCNKVACEDCCLDENNKKYKCYFCDKILCGDCVDDVEFVDKSPYVPRGYPILTGCKNCKKNEPKKNFKCKDCYKIGEFGKDIDFCDTCDNTFCNDCLVGCSNSLYCENSRHGNNIARICLNCRFDCKKCKQSYCEACISNKKTICWDCCDK